MVQDRRRKTVVFERERDIPHYAIGTLTQLLGDIVALINDEVLVEHLEDFAALKVCHCVTMSSIVVPK